MVVGPVRALRHHDVGGNPGRIGLEGERQQVEHELDLLIEVVQLAHRSLWHLHLAEIACRALLHPPLDLAHRFEMVVENHPVVGAELALQGLRAVLDEIEKTRGLVGDCCAFLRSVAFAEELKKDFARVVFHRQR